jgi:curved DNA-binding protein
MDYKDYYQVLGVPRTASEDEIKKSYRKLAMKFHPDRNRGNKAAEDKLKDLNEAYEVLGDPEKRARYNQLGSAYQQYQRGGGAPGGFDWSQWQQAGGGGTRVQYGDLSDLFGNFSDFFQTIFGEEAANQQAGRFQQTATRTRRQQPLQPEEPARDLPDVEVQLSLEEAFTGTKRTVQVDKRRLEVKIPAGVRTGTRIRLAGEGRRGVNGAGDLYLSVKVAPNAQFERKEDDLYTEVPVGLYTMLLGGSISVPTLTGNPVLLTVPPETQSGQTFRLAGLGMPAREAASPKGDIFVRVKVDLPTHLTEQEKKLIAELARLRK